MEEVTDQEQHYIMEEAEAEPQISGQEATHIQIWS